MAILPNNYDEKIKRILGDQYANKDLSDLKNDIKIQVLQGLYKEDRVAQKVLNIFAGKENWREISLLHRVAKESEVLEKEAREFLKGVLETLGLGRFIKGAHGNPSRFQWFVYEPHSYYLKNVGRAAQGLSTSLRGDGMSREDSEDEDAIGEELERKIELPLPNDRSVTIVYPNDLTPEEFEFCLSWFKLHVTPKLR